MNIKKAHANCFFNIHVSGQGNKYKIIRFLNAIVVFRIVQGQPYK
jgi:hypothetical protein